MAGGPLRWAPSGPCAICGEEFPHLEMDHIVPKHLGGPNDIRNIQWLCPNCHKKKTGDEVRARQSGVSVSDERRKAISEALKQRWANRSENGYGDRTLPDRRSIWTEEKRRELGKKISARKAELREQNDSTV